VRHGSGCENEQHHRDQSAVQHCRETPVDRRIDEDRDRHRDEPDGRVHGLARRLAPARSELGDPADRDDPVDDGGDHSREQQPVEPAHELERARPVVGVAPKPAPAFGDFDANDLSH
jgi:hypothetical protein